MYVTKNFVDYNSSDCESIDSIESVNFFKSVLSFMDEDNNFDEDSGFSSFEKDLLCVACGNLSSFCGNKFPESTYKTSNHLNGLTLTWSPTSVGSRVSAKENVQLQHGPPRTPPNEFWGLISLNTEAERASHSATAKKLFFIKYFKSGMLPDVQNHPVRQFKDKVTFLNPNAEDFQYSRVERKMATKEGSRIKTMVTSTPKKTHSEEEKSKNFKKLTKKSEEFQQLDIIQVQEDEDKIVAENTDSDPIADYQDKKICKFCLKNGEPEQVYVGHAVKDFDGLVTCPILQRHACETCGATGQYSHTRKYCPKNKELIGKYNLSAQPSYKRVTNGVLSDECVFYRV